MYPTFGIPKDSGDFPSTDSQSQAFHRLCTLVNQSEEPGNWQTFITALERAEYTYVVNLLRGEIDNDGHEDREILNIFRPIIIKNISTAEVLDKLYERNVLNDQDREEIQSEIKRRGDIAAACMLLYKVPRREPNWFSIFVTVLRELKMDFLADQLDVPTHSKVPSTVCVTSQQINGGTIQVQEAVEHSTPCKLRTTSVSNEYVSAGQLKFGLGRPPPLPARSKTVADRNPDKGGAQSEYADQDITRKKDENAHIHNQTLHENRKYLGYSVEYPQRVRDQRSEQLRLEAQLCDEYKELCNAFDCAIERFNESSPQTSEIRHYRERVKILDRQLRSLSKERKHSIRTELKEVCDLHVAVIGNYSASSEEENHYTSTFDGEIIYPDKDHNEIAKHIDQELDVYSGISKEKIICDGVLNCLIVKTIDTPSHEQFENYEEPYKSSVFIDELAQTVEWRKSEDLGDSSENNSVDAEYETTDVEKRTSAISEISELKQMIGELKRICLTSNETIGNLQRQMEEMDKFVRNEKAESKSLNNIDDKHGYVTCMQPPT
ncbi:uncharacterized protein LOC127877829 isoform X2 [Dreissena polymorpha]|uniref:uncharacterized protein LOC127877829 isoform X2 n=1 Tax=Dreissena polymorpha TaxID=45954 RepID=UPI0022656193|nr:uncharacterized protein LOC127877829 isoform X2 [Dreissena polymorpha]